MVMVMVMVMECIYLVSIMQDSKMTIDYSDLDRGD